MDLLLFIWFGFFFLFFFVQLWLLRLDLYTVNTFRFERGRNLRDVVNFSA
jgi:hypothetical protein